MGDDITAGDEITAHLYLLLPLASSVIFALATLFASKAIQRGAAPWTGTFYGNLMLGGVWAAVGLTNGQVALIAEWPRAATIGTLFVLGQVFTYMAFRFGDVSVATPVFGVKILFVAILSSVTRSEPVSSAIWMAAGVATCGVALVQWRPRREHTGRRDAKGVVTVVLAMLAAFFLSVFDILLQSWGPRVGTRLFLPVVFVSAALVSCLLLPWVDRLQKLRELQAAKPMLTGSFLLAIQAVGMCTTLSTFGNATRVNVVYALRGLWAVGLAWWLAHYFEGGERHISSRMMLLRATGALLLTVAVVAALL